MTQYNNQGNDIDQLIAQDLSAEDLDNVTAAGFTTAGSFFSAGTASCPASSAGSAGSFSSAGG
ncbi:thiocillin family RiPP [Kocuria sp. cx-455]|uniref:thiocillin family RiPP n=1 Tax=Bacteria TaxID=2 RepID=UPI001686ACB6|nr:MULTISPECIES: thiocillin family RiPP [Bacteria]MBD2761890.1 thiocillin family RiPP [Kocuria sp. cx-116]MBD2763880.1 thiocillin family RiPP [Kocuria sp. cx-455]